MATDKRSNDGRFMDVNKSKNKFQERAAGGSGMGANLVDLKKSKERKRRQAEEGRIAWLDYQRQEAEVRKRTERLRAERLERERKTSA